MGVFSVQTWQGAGAIAAWRKPVGAGAGVSLVFAVDRCSVGTGAADEARRVSGA
jgi:hypothetical protein